MPASRLTAASVFVLALSALATAQPAKPSTSVATALGKLPVAFIENQGQWDTDARFVARRGGLTARLEPGALVLQVEGKSSAKDDTIRGAVVRLAFEGCARNARLVGEKRQPGRYNYLLGNDRGRWRTGVRAYGSVLYRGLYDGIDVRVREGDGRILEYDVLAEPGADVRQVVVRCAGARKLRLAEDGSLVIETAVGDVQMKRPTSWEENTAHEKTPIDVRYRLLGENRFAFDAPGRRLDLALVIDPGLVYSTFLGGSAADRGIRVAVDAKGVATVAGNTSSMSFPTTPGAYDRTHNGGGADVFVTRLDPSKTGAAQLVYSTFLGGGGDDGIRVALTVDVGGVATVAGFTQSTNFPTTPGAYDRTHNGGPADVFVSRLDPSKTGAAQLVYSTFLGGSGDDGVRAVSVAANGVVTIAGVTQSNDFPTTATAYDTTHNGSADAFVTRLDPSKAGTAQLVVSTFLGGVGWDVAGALVVDPTGTVTVQGMTHSANFPTTPGAYDRTHNGGPADVFVSRLDPSKTGAAQLVYSTFLGGVGKDGAHGGLAVDVAGVVTVAGRTTSTDFPTTATAYDTTYNGGTEDGYVARLDPRLTGSAQLVYSTFLGGGGIDTIRRFAVDTTGVVTVAGHTSSSDFPATNGAHDTTYNGLTDAIVARLDPRQSGSAQLVYSTFLGGSADDSAAGLAIDAAGVVTVAGSTQSTTFPTTKSAYDTTHNGADDAFVTRLAITCLTGTGILKPGTTVALALSAPGDAGLPYLLGSSLGIGPIQIGSRKLGLSPDNLLVVSVNGWWASIFSGYQGVIGTNGQAQAAVNIPNWSVLVGNTIHTAFVTVDQKAPQGIKSISNTYSFTIVP